MNKWVKLAQLRYNIESDGEHFCWRLVLDDEEILVQSVQINAPSFTSTDWVEKLGKFKHHISIKNCYITIDQNNNALITGQTA